MNVIKAIRILGTSYPIPSQSDAKLILDVTAQIAAEDSKRAAKGQSPLVRKTPKGVPQLHGHLELRPSEVLHHLARSIPQQPFMGTFLRMMNWADVKYIGMFAEHADSQGVKRLRLDALADRYRGNMRRILSEELGVGFGQAVAEKWVLARYPQASGIMFADVDTVLGDGTVPGLTQVGQRRPDYVVRFSPSSASGSIRHLLVECKGASDEQQVHGQLARAMSQLVTITCNGNALSGLAVSNVSTSGGVNIYAVDPEGEEPELKISEFEQGAGYLSLLEDVEGVVYGVEGPRQLSAFSGQAISSLAEFAGSFDAADRWMSIPRQVAEIPEQVTVDTSAGSFVGAEIEFRDRESKLRLNVFRGVEAGVHHAIASGGFDDVASTQAEFSNNTGRSDISIAHDDVLEPVISTLSDGSCLIVRVTH